MEEQKASWATKINYGIGAMGKSLSYGTYGQLDRFLQNILHIDQRLLMPLFFFEKLWDGINDMMMGTVIDNTRTKWGKFRPWCAIGAVTNAAMVVATFGPPSALLQRPAWLFKGEQHLESGPAKLPKGLVVRQSQGAVPPSL